MLVAALAAGIFEETGRLFGFKVHLKGKRQPSTAIAYGIGHGGAEVILLLGLSYFNLFLTVLGYDFGTADINAYMQLTASAITIPTAMIVMIERISAMMIHIGLSMVVFVAANNKKKLWLYPVAIFLHAVADSAAALYQYGIVESLFAVETIAFFMGLLCMAVGMLVLSIQKNEEPPVQE